MTIDPVPSLADAEAKLRDGSLDAAVAFPPDGSVVEFKVSDPGLILRADGGSKPLRWMIDGTPLPAVDLYAQKRLKNVE